MPHKHYRPQKTHRRPKKRSGIERFFLIVSRIVARPLKVTVRMMKGKQGWKGFFKLALLTGIVGFVLLGLVGLITVGIYSRDLPDPNKLIDRQVAQSTKIYDRTGENLLYEISGDQKRTVIKLEDLPGFVPQAVIALEDKTFYEHSGFNYRRLFKAVIFKIIGRRGPGASTLTSQLVKNAILTPERTISRKLKEFILVFQIERKFDKDQILQLYLNEIPYGSTAYGVESAANYYFDKHAQELTIAESALLAAIIQRPTYYSPYGNNVEDLLNRKDITLRLMADQAYISEQDRDDAINEELVFKPRRENISAPHFVFYVREKLVEKYGEHMVNQGGLIVKTTLDMDKQKIAEEVLVEQAEKNLAHGASNAALVSLDPKTGEILSMVGSADYFNDEIDGQVNVTTRPRQPGSSMKPLVYTLAWQRGYAPTSILFDVVTTFPAVGKAYAPKNYDLSERGPVSLRKALQGSLNIPAVKVLYLVGVENFLDFAEELGYTTLLDRSRFGLSLVLGGGEVTLLEHTAAFGTLAAEGEYREPLSILEVSTSDGHVLDTFESKPRRAIDENIANITTNVLSDNGARAYVFGLGSYLQLGGRPAAAKTGTTDDYRDAWTVGYTPSLVTGVWVGNNDFSEMNRGAGGSLVAAPIWQAYMLKALEGTDVESFTPAKLPRPDKPVLSGQGFGMTQVTIDRASEKLATNLTPDSFKEEKLFIEAHTILHYINRFNPNGPAPENLDPQYDKWESAVQGWLNARIEANEPIFNSAEDQGFPEGIEIVYGLPPEEEDDLHIEENLPSIGITSPEPNSELKSRSITIEVNATAARGVARVEYFFDDIYIGTSASAPFSLTTSLKSFPNGFYRLKAVAYDDIDNQRQTSQQIELQSNESYVKINWQAPDDGAEYEFDQNAIAIQLEVDSPDQVNQVTFFANDGVNNQLIEALISPAEGVLEVLWTPPEPGNYRIFAKVSLEGFGVFTTPGLTVTIKEPPEPEEEASE